MTKLNPVRVRSRRPMSLSTAANFKVPGRVNSLDCRRPDDQLKALRKTLRQVQMRLSKAMARGDQAKAETLVALEKRTIGHVQRVAAEVAKWQEGAQAEADRYHKG